MKAIHAIYERGVFRPLEAVDLPETTKVVIDVIEPQSVLPPLTPEARAEVIAILSQRLDPGEDHTESNVEEDGCSSSLLELADHAEPMGNLTNAEIDRAVYGG